MIANTFSTSAAKRFHHACRRRPP